MIEVIKTTTQSHVVIIMTMEEATKIGKELMEIWYKDNDVCSKNYPQLGKLYFKNLEHYGK